MSIDVSVIVPAYNCENYLFESVMSLLQQHVSVDYEILVINDASSDRTGYNVENLDPKIRVIHLSKNVGAAIARDIGIEHAQGQILVFQDADDIALPNKLSLLLSGLERGFVASFGRLIFKSFYDTNGSILVSPSVQYDLNDFRVIHDPLAILLNQYHPIESISNMATYKHYAMKSKINTTFFKVAEDYLFQLKLARFGPFILLNNTTVVCRSRPDSLTKRIKTLLQIGYSLWAAETIYSKLSSDQKKRYKNIVINRMKEQVPFVLPASLLYHHYRLAFRLFCLLIKYRGSVNDLLKRFYWGYLKYREEKFLCNL